MADCRITCIVKPDRFSKHEHITHVGNPQVGWKWSREQVIESIDSGTNTFYVQDQNTNERSEVGVVRESGKLPYLRTHANGYWNDNLLSLNQCPIGLN